MDHKVNGNSAFFSRSEKATFAEILKLDSTASNFKPEEVQRTENTHLHSSTLIRKLNFQEGENPLLAWSFRLSGNLVFDFLQRRFNRVNVLDVLCAECLI